MIHDYLLFKKIYTVTLPKETWNSGWIVWGMFGELLSSFPVFMGFSNTHYKLKKKKHERVKSEQHPPWLQYMKTYRRPQVRDVFKFCNSSNFRLSNILNSIPFFHGEWAKSYMSFPIFHKLPLPSNFLFSLVLYNDENEHSSFPYKFTLFGEEPLQMC